MSCLVSLPDVLLLQSIMLIVYHLYYVYADILYLTFLLCNNFIHTTHVLLSIWYLVHLMNITELD